MRAYLEASVTTTQLQDAAPAHWRNYANAGKFIMIVPLNFMCSLVNGVLPCHRFRKANRKFGSIWKEKSINK